MMGQVILVHPAVRKGTHSGKDDTQHLKLKSGIPVAHDLWLPGQTAELPQESCPDLALSFAFFAPQKLAQFTFRKVVLEMGALLSEQTAFIKLS